MKRFLVALWLGLLFGSCSLQAQSAPAAVVGQTYSVANAVLNMRSGPSLESAVVMKLSAGDQVILKESRGSWWLVEYAGQLGFVAAKYLRSEDLTGWEPTSYSTGTTPDCENVTPKYDYAMDNFLRVMVGNNTDVVVKLMRMGTYQDECIRIIYVRAGDSYELKNIPEGRYYLKIAYGKDYRQRIEHGQCMVRFVKNALYEKGTDILDFNKKDIPGGWQEPSYELTLNVITSRYETSDFNSKNIGEEEFNK